MVPRLRQAGYQIEPTDMRLLISDGMKREAIKDNIRKALEEHLGQSAGRRGDRVFSGHGYAGEHGEFWYRLTANRSWKIGSIPHRRGKATNFGART